MRFELTDKIIEHFKVDPVMHKVMQKYPFPERGINENHFEELIRSIIYQQISIKAGKTVFARLTDCFPITPESLYAASVDEIQACGLTFKKVEYMKSLAKAILDRNVHFDNIEEMSDKEIIKMLVQVKGIGVWTAEMFLMFSLGRPDVNSYGDLAIRRGFKNLYRLENEPTKKEFMEMVSIWSPYSTYAHFYLWFASGENTFL